MSFQLLGTLTCDGCGAQAPTTATTSFLGTFHDTPEGWRRTTSYQDVCPTCAAKCEQPAEERP